MYYNECAQQAVITFYEIFPEQNQVDNKLPL